MALITIDNLPQTATVWTPDNLGSDTPDWTAGAAVDIFVQPLNSEEDLLVIGTYPNATHKAFMQNGDYAVTGLRVRYVVDGVTYEQVGPAKRYNVGKLDHLELPLQEITTPSMT